MSKFKIFDIRKSKPGNRLYFLDANIWLIILQPELRPKWYEEIYSEFFATICSLNKKVIVLNSLLISEVFNRFLKIRFASYKNNLVFKGVISKQAAAELDFKRDYRITEDYEKSVQDFTSELIGYSSFFEIVNDRADEVDILELLDNFSSNADFNDIYYYRFCKLNGYPIVTHDGDFTFEDLPILTCNKELLKISQQ